MQIAEKIPIDRKVNYDFGNVENLSNAIFADQKASKSKWCKQLGNSGVTVSDKAQSRAAWFRGASPGLLMH